MSSVVHLQLIKNGNVDEDWPLSLAMGDKTSCGVTSESFL